MACLVLGSDAPAAPTQVGPDSELDRAFWALLFDVSAAELAQAVDAVGPTVLAIDEFLRARRPVPTRSRGDARSRWQRAVLAAHWNPLGPQARAGSVKGRTFSGVGNDR